MITAPVARAIALFMVAISIIPIVDAVAKTLSTRHDISPVTVTLLRFVAQTIVILAIFVVVTAFQRKRPFDDVRPPLPSPRATMIAANIGRGLLHGGATMFFFIALKYMPLADTIAVFFVEPMIVLLLSAVFLGEFVGWPRRIASVVAFAGALLIIQPSYALFGPVSLLPLLAALCFALYFIITRRLTQQDHPLTMQLLSLIHI